MKTLTNIFIFLLMVISGYVALFMMMNHTAPWSAICLYWIALTVKNSFDWGDTL